MSEQRSAIPAHTTLKEKIDLLTGANVWVTVPKERPNIPMHAPHIHHMRLLEKTNNILRKAI